LAEELLAAVGEPSLLIPTIAGALGIQEGPGLNVAAQLRERLTDAQMLLVLDSIEQLTEAAAKVSDLLAGAASLQILVTSRSILDIRGETAVRLRLGFVLRIARFGAADSHPESRVQASPAGAGDVLTNIPGRLEAKQVYELQPLAVP
jgi:predicted ATPase